MSAIPEAEARAQIAELIRAIGLQYQDGRRYRAIARLCEETHLGRALEIGAAVRRALRAGDGVEFRWPEAIDQLRELRAECAAAIVGVRASAPYRRAVTAWTLGRQAELAELAPAIFASVVRDPAPTTLYLPISVRAPRGGREHFLPAGRCAEAIARRRHEGLTAAQHPPALGADDEIRAVLLAREVDEDESPVALTIDAAAPALPVFRVDQSADALVYAARIVVPFAVRLADTACDEWWAARPGDYRHYRERLAAELAACGIAVHGSG